MIELGIYYLITTHNVIYFQIWTISKLMRHVFSDPYLGSLFRGTNPMDQLPPCEDGAYVFNLSNSKSEGTHWVTVYIFHGSLDYMDSYGRNAPAILKRWGKKCSWNENPYSLQSPFTAVCGQYCIYFLTQRARDIPFQILLGNFSNNVDWFMIMYKINLV